MNKFLRIAVSLLVATGFRIGWVEGSDSKPAAPAEVESLLATSCASCHSGAKAAGKLRLDSLAELAKGGVSGPAVVPGHSDQSSLLQRVLTSDRAKRMPLGGSPLRDEQIALLKRWIDAGAAQPAAPKENAAARKHWAYIKPVRPAVPAVKGTARNPIDNFILARLEKEKLGFSPEASKEALIRRVSLDLTGLPPTLEEIDAFLADNRADAYEQLVERLLASPHYGERWARPWLDLARYADTNGYEADRQRTMWKYRD